MGPVNEKQNRPYQVKLTESWSLINKNIHIYGDDCVIGWSGGRNSMIVLDLARRIKPDIHVVFNDTGVEFPETIQFVHRMANEWNINLWIVKSDTNYWKVAEKFGFALGSKNPVAGMTLEDRKHANAGKRCCYHLKDKLMLRIVKDNEWKAVFDGTTAAENRQRTLRAVTHGACFHYIQGNFQKIKPILWWTDTDVEQYHQENNLPKNPLYLQGSKRVGCMTCSAFKRWEEEMYRLTPKLHTMIRQRMGKPVQIPPGCHGPCSIKGNILDPRDQPVLSDPDLHKVV